MNNDDLKSSLYRKYILLCPFQYVSKRVFFFFFFFLITLNFKFTRKMLSAKKLKESFKIFYIFLI